MQVIRNGYQVTCKCTSVLQYTPKDMHVKYQNINVSPYDVETMPEKCDHYYCFITCPVCGSHIRVKGTQSVIDQHILSEERFDHDL